MKIFLAERVSNINVALIDRKTACENKLFFHLFKNIQIQVENIFPFMFYFTKSHMPNVQFINLA